MAILRASQRTFKEEANRIDNFRLFSDISRIKNGINPKNLNFDIRQLNPLQYSSPYHFHRFGEELFVILSGSATLRSPKGLDIVESGDMMFFEMGETGAHQLYNHTDIPCTFLDIRSFIGYDVCEYPDSNKIYLVPSNEIFDKSATLPYFTGEEAPHHKWQQL
jgi:uncharacterized cupin superfamily protein